MKISEFIANDLFDQIANTTVERMIHECLEILHILYGPIEVYATDQSYGLKNEYLDIESWEHLKALAQEEGELDLDADDFVENVNSASIKMSNSICVPYSRGEDLFSYKNKPMYDASVSFPTAALILALKELIPIYNEDNPCVESVARAATLIQCSEHMQLIGDVSLLWACESQRPLDHEGKKNRNFDSKPSNAQKKAIVEEIVVREQNRNNAKGPIELFKITALELEDKLIDLEAKGALIDKGEESTSVSPGLLRRWIDESINR